MNPLFAVPLALVLGADLMRCGLALMLFVGGARVKSHVGLLNREKIEKLLDA